MKERRIEKRDLGLERMMMDLRLKDSVIESKDVEISSLKNEIEERVSITRR